MVNSHNLCMFEGRITQDPEYTQVQTANGAMDKVTFSIAVDRKLTSQQRQASKNGDQSIVTSDFVRCSLIGNAVNTFKQYCPKGKAITVTCTYATYKSTNQQTGQTQYGHIFNVEDFSFTVADAKNMGQGGGQPQMNGNNNGYNQGNYQQNNGYGQQNNGYGQPNNGYGQPQQQNFMNAPQPQGNFEMFDNSNSASPF